MKFLEKDLEDIIWEAPSEWLEDRGLCLHHRKKRQLRIGNYGIADIVAFAGIPEDQYYRGFLDVQVLELKKGMINSETVSQALRYATGIRKYVTHFRGKFELCLKTNIICIGDDVKDDDLFYLTEFNQLLDVDITLQLYTYSYDWDGIAFKEHIHSEVFGCKDHGFGDRPIRKHWTDGLIISSN